MMYTMIMIMMMIMIVEIIIMMMIMMIPIMGCNIISKALDTDITNIMKTSFAPNNNNNSNSNNNNNFVVDVAEDDNVDIPIIS